ncbi:MAG: hypothetical protein HYZ34_08905, partial [Ignavibacteriae bacterium]|nr:hypothetical protein [Ignavibacteriota bacterium]
MYCNKIAFSQTENLRFEHLTTSDGLSEGVVYKILQDSRGYLWFATHDGLNRYDGYSFTVFKNMPFDSLSLWNNHVLELFEDSRKILWVGTIYGLHRFDYQTETFHRYLNDVNDVFSLPNNSIVSMNEDRFGNLWIGTENGLCYIETGMLKNERLGSLPFHRIESGFLEKTSQLPTIILSLLFDSEGTLWIGTNNHLYSLREGDTTVTPMIQGEKSVVEIHEEPRGVLWLGTLNGLSRYEIGTKQYQIVPEIRSKDINDHAVREIITAHDGNLWFATHAGLYQRDSKSNTFQRYTNQPTDSRSLSNNRLYSLCQDNSGVLWIGTFGSGVDRINLQQKRFIHYKHLGESVQEQRDNMVISLLEDHLGKIWIGTWENNISVFDRKTDEWEKIKTPYSTIHFLKEDRYQNIWIGTGEFLRYNRKANSFITTIPHLFYATYLDSASLWCVLNGIIYTVDLHTQNISTYSYDAQLSGSTSAIISDSSGHLWFNGNGLHVINLKTKKVKSYYHDPRNQKSISSYDVSSIHFDASGVLWVGTIGGGLNRFNSNDETFTHYLEEDGLANNVVYGILEDEQNNLWLSTNRGISRFNPATGQFRNYDVDDGLQANEFNNRA